MRMTTTTASPLTVSSKRSRIFPYPGRMANTCRQTSMETAPGTHENPKTKEKCNIKRMIIAYKRPINLGNLLSHRDVATGPPVSSYLYD